jgi:hypothetical protein
MTMRAAVLKADSGRGSGLGRSQSVGKDRGDDEPN